MIETDDFLADLESHLRAAAEREEARRAAPRWRRAAMPGERRPVPARGPRPAVVRLVVPVLAVAALIAIAVAVLPLRSTERPVQAPTPTASATATPSPALVRQATADVRRAAHDTARRPSCQFVSPGKRRLVDGTPLPAITAALPALAVPGADSGRIFASLPGGTGGPILRSTLRQVRFGGGVTVNVFVIQGREFPVADPAACGRARAALITARTTGALRAAALAQLAADPVTSPQAQTLVVQYGRAAGPRASIGVPLAPGGRPVPVGVIGGGGADGDRTYVGIADPRAVTARAGTLTVKVRDGLYAFRNPPRKVFEELDAAGKALRRDTVH